MVFLLTPFTLLGSKPLQYLYATVIRSLPWRTEFRIPIRSPNVTLPQTLVFLWRIDHGVLCPHSFQPNEGLAASDSLANWLGNRTNKAHTHESAHLKSHLPQNRVLRLVCKFWPRENLFSSVVLTTPGVVSGRCLEIKQNWYCPVPYFSKIDHPATNWYTWSLAKQSSNKSYL